MAEIKKIELKTKGMHCVSCENIIKGAILSVGGVLDAKVDYIAEKAVVEFDPKKTDIKNIMKAVKDSGYQPEEIGEKKNAFKRKFW